MCPTVSIGVGGNWHLHNSYPSALATSASAIRDDDSAVANAAVIVAALSSCGRSSLVSFTSPMAARNVSKAVFTKH
jgi:hypothetical protein